jgi:hypothetical protein
LFCLPSLAARTTSCRDCPLAARETGVAAARPKPPESLGGGVGVGVAVVVP